MKKLTVFTILTVSIAMTLLTPQAMANNISVSDVALQNIDEDAGTVEITFDLSWDNSYSGTDANSAAYFDRAWVFVKFWDDTWTSGTDPWQHATLVTGGTVTTYDGETDLGITSDGKGAFCNSGSDQTVKWDYAADGLSATDTAKVKVMAIEMVLIPAGPFYVGSGGEESGSFTDGSWTSGATIPLKIESEDELTIAQTAGNLWGTSSSGYNTIGPAGALPAAYPKGYNGFYIMKYELSQGQYRDFLNTLTRADQDARTGTSLPAGTTAVTNRYVMSNTSTKSTRNGIRCDATIHTSEAITFYCDYDGNGTPNESTDGEWGALNWICWADYLAYADWAGLRPMTELEFEKACRGGSATDNTVANEYAWGTATIASSTYTVSNAGTSSEGIATNYSTVAGNCANGAICASAPLRCGIFAANSANTGRVTSGASYYGVMELSGNLWEMLVTAGNTQGRDFTGVDGDGDLSTTPDNWPSTGFGLRGGSVVGSGYEHVSNRSYAVYPYTSRYNHYTGRCARTSP